MGKISRVKYKQIDNSIFDIRRAEEFYFYYNLIGMNDNIDDEYIKYEEDQSRIRNSTIKEMTKNKMSYKSNTVMMIPSPLQKKVVCIIEV